MPTFRLHMCLSGVFPQYFCVQVLYDLSVLFADWKSMKVVLTLLHSSVLLQP